MLLVVIGLTGCNSAGLPRADLPQGAIYQLVATVDKDDASPPTSTPAVSAAPLTATDGQLHLAVPELSRRGPSIGGFVFYDLVGGAYAQTLTVCGAIEDLLLERTDGDNGLSDRVSARVTETWSATAARERGCNLSDAMPDTDGETVVTLTFDVKERCGCTSVAYDASGELHCGACPAR
jgi:hypothetical protein